MSVPSALDATQVLPEESMPDVVLSMCWSCRTVCSLQREVGVTSKAGEVSRTGTFGHPLCL